ncbi:MAG TPA: 4-hydroxy-tetrahydrodipicolinate reductase, partial [Bacteroidia bacterium]|nr:4-hydroxy-tetrahydrodipicolinate reductase [Bacteroidia bacterium]
MADILNLGKLNIPIFESIETALEKVDFDVLVDYTRPEIGKKNIISTIKKGKSVVVGTSG